MDPSTLGNQTIPLQAQPISTPAYERSNTVVTSQMGRQVMNQAHQTMTDMDNQAAMQRMRIQTERAMADQQRQQLKIQQQQQQNDFEQKMNMEKLKSALAAPTNG